MVKAKIMPKTIHIVYDRLSTPNKSGYIDTFPRDYYNFIIKNKKQPIKMVLPHPDSPIRRLTLASSKATFKSSLITVDSFLFFL